MATVAQPSLSDILRAPFSASDQTSFQLPSALCYGDVSSGGFVASVMVKYTLAYASHHPKLKDQPDVRSAYVQFYRPLFPARGSVIMNLREVSIGRAWSTLRVEMFQGSRSVAASADVMIQNFSLPGKSLESGWSLSPPLRQVDLDSLQEDGEPGWTCYHTAFTPSGYRRVNAYVKIYIPINWPQQISYVEQWMTPGWDCTPLGSRDETKMEARWTNDMIPFVADMLLAVQENFGTQKPGQLPLASIAATLGFSATQKEARLKGHPHWRVLPNDGQDVAHFEASFVNVTLSLSIEIKKKLPKEGTRWICLRSAVKRVDMGRVDVEVLLFDEKRELIAISSQVTQFISPADKKIRKASI